MKVDYRTASGYVSTAYLDEVEEDFAKGTNKHTDEPVTLWWDGREWEERQNP